MEKNNISDWMLERYLLQELPENKIKEIDGILNQYPDIRKRADKIRISDENILKKYKPEQMTRRIMTAFNSENPIPKASKIYNFKRFLIPSFAFACTIFFFVFIFPVKENSIRDINKIDTAETTRIKGDERQLYIYRKIHYSIELLKNGSRAYKNDLLQIAFRTVVEPYVVIFSIDGRGSVTLHYPKKETESAMTPANKKVFLANAYELDDSPKFERFFMITSKNKLNVDDILESAKDLARYPERALKNDLKIDSTANQISITLEKGDR